MLARTPPGGKRAAWRAQDQPAVQSKSNGEEELRQSVWFSQEE
jgi:hypothetical protein